MKKVYLILLLLSPLVNYSQISNSWEGHYKGKLATQSQSKTSKYYMEIIFLQLNDSTYNWTIIYGQDSLRQERKYLLKKTGENQYEVDE